MDLKEAWGFLCFGCFSKFLTILLKFRTLLSIRLSLSCRFPGSPPKRFTLFCSSERVALTVPPSASASSIFLLLCLHGHRLCGTFLDLPPEEVWFWHWDPWWMLYVMTFCKREVPLQICGDYYLSFYFIYGTKLKPFFPFFYPSVRNAVSVSVGLLQEKFHLFSQFSILTNALVFHLLVFNLQIHSQ